MMREVSHVCIRVLKTKALISFAVTDFFVFLYLLLFFLVKHPSKQFLSCGNRANCFLGISQYYDASSVLSHNLAIQNWASQISKTICLKQILRDVSE